MGLMHCIAHGWCSSRDGIVKVKEDKVDYLERMDQGQSKVLKNPTFKKNEKNCHKNPPLFPDNFGPGFGNVSRQK